jgi:hypothetical protein
MANHKKYPIFIRVKSRDNQVICIQPSLIASFQIEEKAKIKLKDGNVVEADTIRLYTAVGTTFSYSVGIEINEQEFGYVCATLIEFLYLNEQEFRAKSEALEKQKFFDWNKAMEDEAEEEKALTEPKA